MTIQLCLSSPNELRQAQNFNELWSSVTNDEVYRLEDYYKIATGSEIVIMSERSNEAWIRLREVIEALELAVSCINQELLAIGRETLEITDSDDKHLLWVLNLPTRIADADRLKSHDYARAIAVYMAGQIKRHAARLSPERGSGKLNPLILFANSAE